jgi:hypothetical protein
MWSTIEILLNNRVVITILENIFLFGPLKMAGTARPITSFLSMNQIGWPIAAVSGTFFDANTLFSGKNIDSGNADLSMSLLA